MLEIRTAEALDTRYEAAKADILKQQRLRQGEAAGLMVMAMAYGEELDEGKALAKAAHVAKLICIAAVFVIPNLLFIRVVL